MKAYKKMKVYKQWIICIMTVVVGLMAASGTRLPARAEDAKPEVDTNRKVTITVNLEDESRFMGIDLYHIGTYDGEKFTYLPEYRKLVEKDYYALDTTRKKDESVQVLAEYLEENQQIKPDASIRLVKGKGKTAKLPQGLYLIVQNDEDHNSELEKVIVTEAPLFDEEQNIYLYDIRLFPKWERTIWFSFRPEVVYPLELVLLLSICLLLCLSGTRLLRSLGSATVFLLSGLFGMKICSYISTQFIWSMVFFTTTAFLGVGVLWMILGILGGAVKKSGAFQSAKKQLNRIVPILSGAAGAYLIYRYISKEWWCFAAIPAAFVVTGEIIRYLRRGKEVVFHTYEDLLELPIVSPEGKQVDLQKKQGIKGEA